MKQARTAPSGNAVPVPLKCLACGGGLTRHDDGDGHHFYAHNNLPLRLTAGHEAVPDPATVDNVEIT
jgi:hypothetical protein